MTLFRLDEPSCGACTGEQCWLCGAGIVVADLPHCDHDVIDRHSGERCLDLDRSEAPALDDRGAS